MLMIFVSNNRDEMTTKFIDKKHARNLFLICLVAGIFLIFWIVMVIPLILRESLSTPILKETIQSFQEVPRIDSSAKAVIAAQTIFDLRTMNTAPSQVLDVKLLTYREAITRLSNGMGPKVFCGR